MFCSDCVWHVSIFVVKLGKIIFFSKFSPNLLNGRIDEDRAHSKQSL